MDEKRLIKRLRQGKADAYRYLFTEYYNALVNLWNKREGLVISASLRNYLFKTCHNQFLQHVRSQKVEFDTLDKIRWDVISEATLEDNLFDFRMEKLHHLIDQLPPRCKEIFIQNKLEKKKYKEIAIDMGISIKTVENQMLKALQFLRANATSFML